MDTSFLDYIHDVKCPVCGRVPTYQITGINYVKRIIRFDTKFCHHPELENLILQREQEILARQEEN